MGSEEKDPCLREIGRKDDRVLYEDICPKKKVYLTLAGTGIVGPKFKVEISGHATDVDAFLKWALDRP